MSNYRARNIAILGTGDMGSAVAASLNTSGMHVLTCLAGRTDRSRALAEAANCENYDTLQQLVSHADILLSIIPPAAAVGFAQEICPLIEATSSDTLFVDCNAVSPTTAAKIAGISQHHSVRFQDAGIVGAAPRQGRPPIRLYTSGPHIDDMQQLATDLIEVKSLGPDVGRASAIKMTYAALTKGTHALRAVAMLLGEQLGVGEEVRAEWQYSLPDVYAATRKRLPILAADSARWTGEMREIAQTCEAAGLPRSFHDGAEWLYTFLAQTELAEESRDEASAKNRSLEETVELLRDAHALYVQNQDSTDA